METSRFDGTAVLPDNKTVVFVFRTRREVVGGGAEIALVSSRKAEILSDQILVGTCSLTGSDIKILFRSDDPRPWGNTSSVLSVSKSDPLGVMLTFAGRTYRIDTVTGAVLAYPLLESELAAAGRDWICKPRLQPTIVDPDGTLLLCGVKNGDKELLIRDPSGKYEALDTFDQFHWLAGSELFYSKSDHRLIARDWRTGASREYPRGTKGPALDGILDSNNKKGPIGYNGHDQYGAGPETAKVGVYGEGGRVTWEDLDIDVSKLRKESR